MQPGTLSYAAHNKFGRERRQRELIADFQLPIVDLMRAAASTQTLGCAAQPTA